MTFIGCRFASNAVEDADVADYGDGIKFLYDTFEPSTVPAGPGPASAQAPGIAPAAPILAGAPFWSFWWD